METLEEEEEKAEDRILKEENLTPIVWSVMEIMHLPNVILGEIRRTKSWNFWVLHTAFLGHSACGAWNQVTTTANAPMMKILVVHVNLEQISSCAAKRMIVNREKTGRKLDH